ncbi:MAG: 1-phosphofructokinase [Oscillospiraceae bacterium]|nr:1-phosphofructokinase [Oscillospiraceae bacterium]
MITTVTLNAAVDKLYLVKKVELDTVMRVEEVCNTAGGKGLNVSKVAALVGERVTATGFLGGFNGRYVKSLLESAGIIPRFAEIDAETRSCINIRDLSTGKHTEYLEPGSKITPENIAEFLRIFKEVLPQSDVVTISGSVPKGTPDDFYGDVIQLCRSAGKPVIVDTSGELLRKTVQAKPTMVKPNTDEIEQLLGYKPGTVDEIVEAAREIHKDGIGYVAVSLGKNGAVLVCDEGVFKGDTPDIPIVNSVGSGDSMVAGFAASISRGYDAAEMLRFAMAVSTANALEMPTGHIRLENVERLINEVTVTKLS